MNRLHAAMAVAGTAVVCLLLAARMSAVAEAALSSCAGARHLLRSGEVSAVQDGATLRLADGAVVRLAGVVAASELDRDSRAVARSRAALQALVAGKRVILYGGEAEHFNRYGMLIAQVVVAGEERQWLQARLVADGMLRVAPEAGEVPCAASLLDIERRARAEKRGIWREPGFAVEQAGNIKALTTAAGRFMLVEGTIRRIGKTSSRTYLDFGRYYTKDFSIVIPRASRAAFAAAGIDLPDLQGSYVRVRGVIVSSGGPAIAIRSPASLEVLAENGG